MRKLLKHPLLVIFTAVIITVFLAIPLKNIRIESSIRQFFPQKHEAYQRLNKTEDTFGSMLAIGISLEAPGATILTKEYIEIIRNITNELEKIENTENITSLTNIDFIEGNDGAINVAPLLEKDLTEEITNEDLLLIRQRLAAWEDMYNLVVISNNWKGTQISLCVNQKTTLAEQQETLNNVRKVVYDNIKDSDLTVRFYGDPVISEQSKSFMLSDLILLIPLVILIVLISLYVAFQNSDGVIFPIITVIMSVIWSVGIMSMTGMEFSLVSSVIPVALIGCGSAYGIHVLNHYYIAIDKKRKELDAEKKNFTKELHIDCIIESLADVKIAIVLSAITTIVGFASLVTSPIRPLFGFAIFTALGIAFSLLLSVTVIPSLLSLKKIENIGKRSKKMEKLAEKVKRKLEKVESTRLVKEELYRKIIADKNEEKKTNISSKYDNSSQTGLSTTLYHIYHFFCGTKPRLVIFSIFIILMSAIGLSKIVIDTSMVNYFPKTAKVRQDIDYVNEKFAGTNSIYLLINSPANTIKKEANDLYDKAQSIEDSFAGKEIDEASKVKINELRARADEKYAEIKTALDMTNPEVLQKLALMKQWMESQFSEVGKAVSYVDSIKRINQVWNAPGASTSDNSAAYSNDEPLDDFGFDDGFGDFGDFGSDFGDFGSAQEDAVVAPVEYVDPNENYNKLLSNQMTGKEIQDLVNLAYAKAGGRNGDLESFIRALQIEMNYNGTAFYEVPYDPVKYQKATRDELSGLISNYTMMLGDSMERFTDDISNFVPTAIRMQVQVKTNSTQVVGKMLKKIEAYAKNNLPEGYTLEATGIGEMEYVMTNLVVSSQMTSLLLSIFLVFLIISISFRSPVAGLIGSIPLAFTIILNYMVMGLTGIKLDLITSIIASVAIGVGIDYTIHFMTEYKSLRLESSNLEFITRQTFKSSGAGIITNALAVGLGFLVLCLSRFVVLRYIGVLVAIVMFTSSMLAMTVLPGIFNIFDPKFMHPGLPKAWETEEK